MERSVGLITGKSADFIIDATEISSPRRDKDKDCKYPSNHFFFNVSEFCFANVFDRDNILFRERDRS